LWAIAWGWTLYQSPGDRFPVSGDRLAPFTNLPPAILAQAWLDFTHLFLEIWIWRPSMKDLQRYLSSAPVLATVWITFTAGLLIEFNRFHPDMLTTPF